MNINGPDVLPRLVVNRHLTSWPIFTHILRKEKRPDVLLQYMREELIRVPCRTDLVRRIYTRYQALRRATEVAALRKMVNRPIAIL